MKEILHKHDKIKAVVSRSLPTANKTAQQQLQHLRRNIVTTDRAANTTLTIEIGIVDSQTLWLSTTHLASSCVNRP
jgi:hypothetical protein